MKKFLRYLWDNRTQTFSFIQGLVAVFAGMTDVFSLKTVKILLAVNAVLTYLLSWVNKWESGRRTPTINPTAVGALIVFIAALAMVGCTKVDAQTTPVVDTLSWTAPTQFTDGSTIPAGIITGYRVIWGAASGAWPNTHDVGPMLTTQLTRAETFGNRCYRVAALIGSVNGEWSVERCKNVQAPPRAPTGFTVQ